MNLLGSGPAAVRDAKANRPEGPAERMKAMRTLAPLSIAALLNVIACGQETSDTARPERPPIQFQVLKGWKVEDIVRALKATPAQVYTVKHRIAGLIKEEVERLEREML